MWSQLRAINRLLIHFYAFLIHSSIDSTQPNVVVEWSDQLWEGESIGDDTFDHMLVKALRYWGSRVQGKFLSLDEKVNG